MLPKNLVLWIYYYINRRDKFIYNLLPLEFLRKYLKRRKRKIEIEIVEKLNSLLAYISIALFSHDLYIVKRH